MSDTVVVADRPVFRPLEDTEARTVDISNLEGSHGKDRVVHEFFKNPSEHVAGPHAFFADYPDTSRTDAHFHPVDQYQIFFGSQGSYYQRHGIPRVLLHYSDAYTVYGPFGTAEEPMSFFTLRAKLTKVTAYMPGSRDLLIRRGRRNIHADVATLLDRPLGSGESTMQVVMEPEEDGQAAYLPSAGPAGAMSGPSPAGSGGQYYCVVSGEVEIGGARYGERALGWCGPRSVPVDLKATDDRGFEVLVAQFPLDTTAGDP